MTNNQQVWDFSSDYKNPKKLMNAVEEVVGSVMPLGYEDGDSTGNDRRRESSHECAARPPRPRSGNRGGACLRRIA